MLKLGVCCSLGCLWGHLSQGPIIPQSSIAGISMGVLALLFAVQPLGSQYLGGVYARILLLWFLLQIVVGIHNIAVFAPWIGKVSLMTLILPFTASHSCWSTP